MTFKEVLERWKLIAGVVAATIGLWATSMKILDDRIQGHVEDGMEPVADQIERQAVAFNLLRCEIKGVTLMDCDPYEGVEER
jgi:hypothetical protein